MKTLEEIKSILAEHREELKGKYKVKEIEIFGSFVKGQTGSPFHIFSHLFVSFPIFLYLFVSFPI